MWRLIGELAIFSPGGGMGQGGAFRPGGGMGRTGVHCVHLWYAIAISTQTSPTPPWAGGLRTETKNPPRGMGKVFSRESRVLVEPEDEDPDGDDERHQPDGTVGWDSVDEGDQQPADPQDELDDARDSVVSFIIHS